MRLHISIPTRIRNTILFFLFVSFITTSCSSWSKSGIRESQKQYDINRSDRISSTSSSKGTTIVKMHKKNGVYQIPVEINGVEMFFIFDTGAGLISISATEASFLYRQGKLKDEDFIGTASFIDANGDISEGTIIKLRTVKIGSRTIRDVEASVVHNMVAPLLIGQSALEKFGKITIDYQKNEIEFE